MPLNAGTSSAYQVPATHTVLRSKLWLGPVWLGANGVALAVAALFVLTSGAYLEWLVAVRSKVGGPMMIAWLVSYTVWSCENCKASRAAQPLSLAAC